MLLAPFSYTHDRAPHTHTSKHACAQIERDQQSAHAQMSKVLDDVVVDAAYFDESFWQAPVCAQDDITAWRGSLRGPTTISQWSDISCSDVVTGTAI